MNASKQTGERCEVAGHYAANCDQHREMEGNRRQFKVGDTFPECAGGHSVYWLYAQINTLGH